MTLSLHKLWAGSGYEYLTRQVARLDATHPGGSPLASYYTERGETPGAWIGSGLGGIEGLQAGDVVAAEQMRSLFGQGRHPLAAMRAEAASTAGASASEVAGAGLLGAPYRSRSTTGNPFEGAVAERLAARKPQATGPGMGALRAEVVSEVASKWFQRHHGRPPSDGRELSGAVARWSAPPSQPVAGFDLTFSPVKSVSALWALAPPPVAAQIEWAHRAAVEDALRFVEQQALFSREGARGVRQVDVRGLVGAAFVHRDSRAGDPDLHTHVAVANKVQTRAGKWLAIDGRVLYAATTAASETYNTALERHLEERVGLRFASRPVVEVGERAKRPVREVVGVDPRLLQAWSSRRRDIDVRRAELGRDFQQRSGRPPTRKEAWALAQQATLETRQAKHEPRTLTEQRTTWSTQASQVLGGQRAVDGMLASALAPRPEAARPVDAFQIARLAAAVVSVMEEERATWNRWHLQAEAQRQVRALHVSPGMTGHVVDLVVGEAVNRCVPLTGPAAMGVPAELQRADGTSVYEVTGAQRWTSARVLAAEEQVLSAAGRRDGRRVDPATVDVALHQAVVQGQALNAGQAGLVRDLAGSGARVQLALAPAGTGKTTALRVLAGAWVSAGGNVVGLAPSAAAAAVLGEQLDGPTDTLAKLVWTLDQPRHTQPAWVAALGAGSLVVIDEAGLADSPSLARAVDHVVKVGGSVRLVGDDQQLGAVGAGGLLRDLAARHGAARLDDVVRFADPAEAAASLALRDGRPEALGFYLDEHRIHVGDPTTTADQLFTAWASDRARGLDSLMLAPTRDLVADLNARARAARLTTQASTSTRDREATLADENRASVGDTIITRTNDRRLRTDLETTGRRRWVRNGDRWTVQHVHRDGRLRVQSLQDEQRVTLPAEYVRASVELGYASTIHAAQGSTCDTVHGLLTGTETRAQLYTLLTRGRTANHAYLQLEPDAGMHELVGPDAAPPRTATQVLEQILAREGDDRSATGHRDGLHNPALRLPDEIDRYLDSLRVAAEHTTPPEVDQHLTATAERLVPGLTDEPAWPTLRSQLLLDATYDNSSIADLAHRLTLAVALQPLDDPDHAAHDRAAVLHRRLLNRQPPPAGGPLPWLPDVPNRLLDHPTWGPYLAAHTTLIADLATAVRGTAQLTSARWTQSVRSQLQQGTAADIAVWRASRRLNPSDPSPLGPPPTDPAAERWYRHLETAISTNVPDHVEALLPNIRRIATDPYRAELSRYLARLADQHVDVEPALRAATAQGPLPDDHPFAALWWRLHRHLPPDSLKAPDALQGPPRAQAPEPHPASTAPGAELVHPDTTDGRVDLALLVSGLLRLAQPPRSSTHPDGEVPQVRRQQLLKVNELTLNYYRDQYAGSWSARYLAERCGSDLRDDSRFFPGHAPAGWTHLIDHLRTHGVTDQDMLDAGVARTTARGHLVDLFRDRLVLPIWNTEHELVGFVARGSDDPQLGQGGQVGPKYLNTPTTLLYRKSRHLYGAHLLAQPGQVGAGSSQSQAKPVSPVPVLVEGPLDAIAVNLADGDRHVGLASLGTALTDQQSALLARGKVDPVLAFDSDRAGTAAAERAFWTLTAANLDPQIATLPQGSDPADLYQRGGAATFRTVLDQAEPLADRLTHHTLQTAFSPQQQLDNLLSIAAARPPRTWTASLDDLAERAGLDPAQLRERLLQHVNADSSTRPIRPPAPPSAATPRESGATRRTTRPLNRGAASTDSAIPAGRTRSPGGHRW